jgi:hypothetical protein
MIDCVDALDAHAEAVDDGTGLDDFLEDPTKAVPDPDPGLGIAGCQIPVPADIARLSKPKLLQILAVADEDETWPAGKGLKANLLQGRIKPSCNGGSAAFPASPRPLIPRHHPRQL